MKKITKCYNCDRVIRLYGSFTAEIEVPQKINGFEIPDKTIWKQVKLCRPCTAEAGYKVKEESND